MDTRRIYIAGPMRGYYKDNFAAFDEARDYLTSIGWIVVSPADLDREAGYDPQVNCECDSPDIGEALLRDFPAIDTCHAIALLSGWEQSSGTAIELAFARELGLDEYLYLTEPHRLLIHDEERHRNEGFYDQLTNAGFDYEAWLPGHGAIEAEQIAEIRTFESGAIRDTEEGKLDYEGYLSHDVLECFAMYMYGKSFMPDGSHRTSDNWQKGLPLDSYMKSMFRHFMAVWAGHRKHSMNLDDLCGLMFNVMGYLHEELKEDA